MADDAVVPEMHFSDDRRESPTSSQNTQEMTTAETNARGVIDFSLYTSAMINEETAKKTEQKSRHTSITQLFSKKPLLQISKLRQTMQQSRHLKQNKLSDKMGRRDIQFYDLYKLDKTPKDVEKL